MAKFCSNCGNKLNENADICLSCGKFVAEKNNKPIKSLKINILDNLFYIYIIPLFMIIVYILLCYFIVGAIIVSVPMYFVLFLITILTMYFYFKIKNNVIDGLVLNSKSKHIVFTLLSFGLNFYFYYSAAFHLRDMVINEQIIEPNDFILIEIFLIAIIFFHIATLINHITKNNNL